jgi:hypothetical protein
MCDEQGAVPYELGADDKTGKLYCPKHTKELAAWLAENAAIEATHENTYLEYDRMICENIGGEEDNR